VQADHLAATVASWLAELAAWSPSVGGSPGSSMTTHRCAIQPKSIG